MLRFLGKTSASMARSGGSSPTESADEGLSTWELVNAPQSDDDDEDLYSYDSDSDSDSVVSDGNVAVVGEPEPNPAQEEDGGIDAGGVISIQALSVSPPMSFPVEMTHNYVHHGYYDDDDVHHDVDDDDDDDDVDDDYDVDDELVPWKLKDRFGKQRIRKMGKRGGPKFSNKSKRMPYYDNRPGFLYGKFRGCC